jgi:hypothetical protein
MEHTTLVSNEKWNALKKSSVVFQALLEQLPSYLAKARWYGGKSVSIERF